MAVLAGVLSHANGTPLLTELVSAAVAVLAIEAMLGGVEVVKQNLTTDATIIRRFCDHCGIGTAQDGAGCLNCRALKAIARGAKSPDHQPNSPQIDNAAAGAINRKPVTAEAVRKVVDAFADCGYLHGKDECLADLARRIAEAVNSPASPPPADNPQATSPSP